MSIAGQWKVVLKSPMGAMPVDLNITELEDGRLEGTAKDKRQTMEIEEGHISGNEFSWVFNLKGMMKMKLVVSGSVDGDVLAASVTVGRRGTFPLNGERVV